MPWRRTEPMEQRIEFALGAVRTLNFRALCQEYGISAKTGYKWKERFLRDGVRGMEEQSRRPRRRCSRVLSDSLSELACRRPSAATTARPSPACMDFWA